MTDPESKNNSSLIIEIYDPLQIYYKIQKELEGFFHSSSIDYIFTPIKSRILLSSTKICFNVISNEKALSKNQKNLDEYLKILVISIESKKDYKIKIKTIIKNWIKSFIETQYYEWIIIILNESLDKFYSEKQNITFFDKLKKDFEDDVKYYNFIVNKKNKSDIYLNRCFEIDLGKISKHSNEHLFEYLVTNMISLLTKSYNNRNVVFNEDSLDNDIDLKFKSFYTKLNSLISFNNMKFFKDSFKFYDNLEKDLKILCLKIPCFFYINFDFTKDITEFNIKEFRIEDFFFSKKCIKGINFYDAKFNLLMSQFNFCVYFFENINNNQSSISLLIKLLLKLYNFIIDLKKINSSFNLYNFIFCLIDNCLNFAPVKKVFDFLKDYGNNTNKIDDIHVLFKIRGQLKLIYKEQLKKIVNLNLINYNDVICVQNTTELNEDCSYKELTNILMNKNDFINFYLSITTSIIKDFENNVKFKIINYINLEKCLINFQLKNFSETKILLEKLLESKSLTSWCFLNSLGLNMYLICLEKTDVNNTNLIINVSLNLLSIILNFKMKINFDILDFFNYFNKKNLISYLKNKIENFSLKLKQTIDYPLSFFFSVKIIPFIQSDDSTLEKYFICIFLINNVKLKIDFNFIELIVNDYQKNEIIFRSEPGSIQTNEKKKIFLFTNYFRFGIFFPSKIIINVNKNLNLIKNYQISELKKKFLVSKFIKTKNICPNFFNNYNLKNISKFLNSDFFFYYQDLNKFWCKFLPIVNQNFNKNEVYFKIYNGLNDINDLKISFFFDLEKFNFNLPFLKSKKTHLVHLSFKNTSLKKKVLINAEISYKINNDTFYHYVQNKIFLNSFFNVNVKNFFMEKCIFYHFEIEYIKEETPIQVIDYDFTTNKNEYKVVKPEIFFKNQFLWPNKKLKLFLKVFLKKNYIIKKNDFFDLKIKYLNIYHDYQSITENLLLKLFIKHNVSNYWFLISFFFFNQIKFDFEKSISENIIIIKNINTLKFIIFNIIDCFIALENKKKDLKTVFEFFFTEKLSIPKKYNNFTSVNPISIAGLNFLQIYNWNLESKKNFKLEHPIKCLLRIETINYFSTCNDSKNTIKNLPTDNKTFNGNNNSSNLIEFQLNICDDSNWVILGFKNKVFYIDENEKKNIFELNLILIPLKTGELLLPEIDTEIVQLENIHKSKFLLKDIKSVFVDSLTTKLSFCLINN